MDRCLDCRACVTACPSGVPYGAIFERTHAALAAPADLACCGALHLHAGLRDAARALALRNLVELNRLEVDAIVVNAAGIRGPRAGASEAGRAPLAR